MVYDLPVADEKIRPHQVTALHLISGLTFFGTGAIIFVYNAPIALFGLALLIFGILLMGATIAKNKWLTQQVNLPVRIIELVTALSILALSVVNQWKFPMVIFGVLSAAIAFAIYWEKAATTALFIHIDDSGVKLPVVSRKRFIPWVEVEQVVLRYGILTVDCINNTLYQWTITGKEIDNEILEAYCLAQVEAHKKNRINDDW
ncbi:MAG: hypothetical protein V4649_06235 [Bacteroidota bacterium]